MFGRHRRRQETVLETVRRNSHEQLLAETSALAWTLGEEHPGIWVVRGPGIPPGGYGAQSLQGIRDFLEGFQWGRASVKAP